jgi:hypothetical protein
MSSIAESFSFIASSSVDVSSSASSSSPASSSSAAVVSNGCGFIPNVNFENTPGELPDWDLIMAILLTTCPAFISGKNVDSAANDGIRVGENRFSSALDQATWGTIVSDLVPGRSYTIFYYVKKDVNGQVDVTVNGNQMMLAKVSTGGSAYWALHTLYFTADDDTALLAFTSSCPGFNAPCISDSDTFSIFPTNDVVGC